MHNFKIELKLLLNGFHPRPNSEHLKGPLTSLLYEKGVTIIIEALFSRDLLKNSRNLAQQEHNSKEKGKCVSERR